MTYNEEHKRRQRLIEEIAKDAFSIAGAITFPPESDYWTVPEEIQVKVLAYLRGQLSFPK